MAVLFRLNLYDKFRTNLRRHWLILSVFIWLHMTKIQFVSFIVKVNTSQTSILHKHLTAVNAFFLLQNHLTNENYLHKNQSSISADYSSTLYKFRVHTVKPVFNDYYMQEQMLYFWDKLSLRYIKHGLSSHSTAQVVFDYRCSLAQI